MGLTPKEKFLSSAFLQSELVRREGRRFGDDDAVKINSFSLLTNSSNCGHDGGRHWRRG